MFSLTGSLAEYMRLESAGAGACLLSRRSPASTLVDFSPQVPTANLPHPDR